MILIPAPCEHCGQIEIPTEVACDTCERVHKIEGFGGIVMRFGYDEEEPEDDETSVIEAPVWCEFHFCDLKCFTEYLNDPTKKERLEVFEEKSMALFLEASQVGLVLYTLGKVDWD